MPPLNSLDTWSIRKSSKKLKPKAKCFLVAEGTNTEFWYLEALSYRLAKSGIPELIELKPVERTDEDRNNSHPKKLTEQALLIADDRDDEYGFNSETDSVVVLFDADIYRGDEEGYLRDLREAGQVAQVAVTNPSFELFLLLHKENAFDEIIVPNRESILDNKYIGSKRRFIEKLASETFDVNVKKNPAVGKISDQFEIAVAAESNLNQDIERAVGNLTSNVGAVLSGIITSGVDND